MGRINGENAGKTGIFPRARSPFGLDRVLIFDGFRPEAHSRVMPPISLAYSMNRVESMMPK